MSGKVHAGEPLDVEAKWSLTDNWKKEGMTMFFFISLLAGTAFIACMIFVARISALAYVGVVGVMSAAMWMPYLMALIYYNTDKGKMFSGLYKKLAYAPLPAKVPAWVKRAMVAHNNSLENFMLFAIAVFFATSMQVPDDELRVACIFYFVCRVYYWIFTVAPEIFMMKTAFWCMGWGACTFIFIKGILESKAVYEI